MAGDWRPLDLMLLRESGGGRHRPQNERVRPIRGFTSPRLVYNLGHAAFEFIESRWGEEGIQQYLFALRKNIVGGGGDPYDDALRLTAEEFDQEFDKYIKDRFKPFRDKERPTDYGGTWPRIRRERNTRPCSPSSRHPPAI